MLEAERWDERYQESDTPWDLGGTTPALIEWTRQQDLSSSRVMVPGCGDGHDAHFLSKRAKTVLGIDYSAKALAKAAANYPDSRVDWTCMDVTTMSFESGFDLAWEYTCLCALVPNLRQAYIRQVAEALAPGGRFVGLTFLAVPNPEDGPPFQIEPDALAALLEEHFEIVAFEPKTERSIKPRRGSEIWFVARKRSV